MPLTKYQINFIILISVNSDKFTATQTPQQFQTPTLLFASNPTIIPLTSVSRIYVGNQRIRATKNPLND